MEKEQYVDVAVDLVKAACEKYGEIHSVSLDRGFWSPGNNDELNTMIPKVVIPKKGYKSSERQHIEDEKEFKKLRHKHSAVESGINALQVHGLGKVLDHGIDGYKRCIALGVVGYNIHRLGSILM